MAGEHLRPEAESTPQIEDLLHALEIEALLRESFPRVERVDYRNSLYFGERDQEDLLAYLRFKLPLLGADPRDVGWSEELESRAVEALRRNGRVVVRKDDTLFICGAPRGG